MAAAASCDRQAPAGLDDAGYAPAFKVKPGGSGEIIVSSVDPPEAEQGVTLDVAVLGENFPRGDESECIDPADGCTWAEFGIDEQVTNKVKTNRTRYVNARKLIANITIDAEAVADLYDAIVSLRGSRGVGTEKFQVKVKPYSDIPLSISFADPPSYGLVSDGNGPYVDGEDPDLSAVIQSSGHLAFWIRQSPRTVRIYLGDPVGTYDPSLMPDHALAAGVHAWIVTQDPDIDSPTTPSDPKGFLKPDLGPLPFYVLWNAEGTTWSLNYGSTCEAENGVWDQDGDFVTIQTSPTGWTLEAPSRPAEGNVWLCRMVDRRGKEKKDHPSPWTKVGRFDVPTLMTLDKLVGP